MTAQYRSLIEGGYYSSNPFDRTVPVSIRCNNPGAINGARWEKTYPGYVDTVETTPGNKTTIFEAPEYGVAVWWELLRRYAASRDKVNTVGGIIDRYGGGQDYSNYIQFVSKQTGFSPSKVIALDNDDDLLTFGKAMFRYEAGRPTPLKDEQIRYGLKLGRSKGLADKAGTPPELATGENQTLQPAPTPVVPEIPEQADDLTLDTFDGVKAIQSVLINCGYLDPPADGGFGPVTKWALAQFAERMQIAKSDKITKELRKALHEAQSLPLTPKDDLIGEIVKAMLRNNYWIARHPDCVNIVYVEGMEPNGTVNDNRNNVFNDLRIIFRVQETGVPVMGGIWDATTEPSRKWTLTPMNPGGAFHIKFGQYKAWIKGVHHTHEALVQAGEIEGYRDPHKTFKRDLNFPVKGSDFGVNQHWGYDLPHDNMGNSSAGCLVGRATKGHREFMAAVLKDPRYQANPAYRFMTAILPAGDVVEAIA
jgi:peptidoglycan hydrolase-like protein with peptidoglycan-binding domain